MSYTFDLAVKDNLWKESIIFMAIFSISLSSVFGINKYFEIKNNWSRMRCRPEVMLFAWFFGKDTDNNMEYCLENAGLQVKQGNLVDPLVKKIDSDVIDLNNQILGAKQNLSSLDKKIRSADLAMNNQSKNLAVSVQKNILALKEGMQKVIAGLIVSNQVNNGVLTTTSKTKALSDSLKKSIEKLPSLVQTPVQEPSTTTTK